jgi:hypothetical protein
MIITYLVIFGLVVVIVVAIYFFGRSLGKEKAEQEATEETLKAIKEAAIEKYAARQRPISEVKEFMAKNYTRD